VIGESLLDGAGRPVRAAPRGVDPTPESVSFAVGADRARHRSAIPTYATVAYGDVYEGIAMRLRAGTNNVEKIFEVAPRADPGRIRLRVDGTDAIAVGTAGELVEAERQRSGRVHRAGGLQDDGRRTHQRRRRVCGRSGRAHLRLALGAYDRSRPLVIDPLLHSPITQRRERRRLGVAVHPEQGHLCRGRNHRAERRLPGRHQERAKRVRRLGRLRHPLSPDLLTRKRSTLRRRRTENAYAIAIHPGGRRVHRGGTTSPNSTLPNVGGSVSRSSAAAATMPCRLLSR
jgi:hypothetical protein